MKVLVTEEEIVSTAKSTKNSLKVIWLLNIRNHFLLTSDLCEKEINMRL